MNTIRFDWIVWQYDPEDEDTLVDLHEFDSFADAFAFAQDLHAYEIALRRSIIAFDGACIGRSWARAMLFGDRLGLPDSFDLMPGDGPRVPAEFHTEIANFQKD